MGVCLPLRAGVAVQLFKPRCALPLTSSCDRVCTVDSRTTAAFLVTRNTGGYFYQIAPVCRACAHLSASTLTYLQTHQESTLKRAALIEVTLRAYHADATQLLAVKQLRGFKRRGAWRSDEVSPVRVQRIRANSRAVCTPHGK